MYKCDICGKDFNLEQGGYLGPNDPESEKVHLFNEFEKVCGGCAMDPGETEDAAV